MWELLGILGCAMVLMAMWIITYGWAEKIFNKMKNNI